MKRSLPVAIALGIALVALLGAGTLNFGLSMLLALPEGAEVSEVQPDSAEEEAPAAPPRSTIDRGLSKRQYIEGVLERNIFDHTAIGKETTGDAGGEGTRTDLDVTLVGTLVAEPTEFSSALIAQNDGTALGYGVGDKLMDATVVAIERTKVTLRRASGAIEYLTLDDEGRPPEPTASRGSDDGDGDIQAEGENQYTVSRDLLDRYVNNLDAISRMGRAIPHRGPDGQIDGYRLSGIRRNSLGEKLGIRNGDIVHSVNGQPLTSVQGAMAAYQTLQNEANFSFQVTRRGQKMTLEYDVQ